MNDRPPEQRGRRVLESVQHLRGIAASLVVLHHSAEGYPGSLVGRLDFGLAGVATFFAISGFIIWTSSRRESPVQFVERRLIRIVPLYWLATAVVLAVGIHSWGKPIFAPPAIVRSLLFIPYFSGEPIPTPYPVLVPGWTLNFEMLFYAVFALGMAVRRPLAVSVLTMSVLFVLGQVVSFGAAPLVLYTQWISILFVTGVIVGWIAPVARRGALLWPIGVPLVLFYNLSPFPHATLFGGIALLIVGLTARERACGWPHLDFLDRLGNASYAIYLFHMPALFMLHFAMTNAHVDSVPWAVYATLCIGVAWAVGLAIHAFVERPLGKWLRRFTERAKSGRSPSPGNA